MLLSNIFIFLVALHKHSYLACLLRPAYNRRTSDGQLWIVICMFLQDNLFKKDKMKNDVKYIYIFLSSDTKQSGIIHFLRMMKTKNIIYFLI